MSDPRKAGHPPGSGAQLAAVERVHEHRTTRAASGAVRLVFSWDPESAAKLGQFIALQQCFNRKEAIQQAIHIAHLPAYREAKCKG